MKFLKAIAEYYYHHEGDNLNRLCFVFPNRRAGVFFKRYIGEATNKPVISPQVITIQDLFSSLSGLTSCDKIDLLTTLYSEYIKLTPVPDTFDDFIYWAEILLGDFDDIDKYMVDAKKVFANIKDLKEIESDYSFLSENQITAVRSFWQNFLPVGDSEKKQKFSSIWELMFPLYENLRNSLLNRKIGYDGMIYREVADSVQSGTLKALEDSVDRFVFVGLNVLSASEKRLLWHLQSTNRADFYWDFHGDMITDSDNRSSLFMSENIKEFPQKINLDVECEGHPEIEVIGVPSFTGQATIVSKILTENGSGIETAVVLPDEKLLLPVLNSIPESTDVINVTMGFPVAGTAISALIDSLAELQKGVNYYKRVLRVLGNSYIRSALGDVATNLEKFITNNNIVYLPSGKFAENEILAHIFKTVDPTKTADYLLEIFEILYNSISLSKIEKEFLYHYYIAVKRLKDIGLTIKSETFFKILNQLVASKTVPFRGEPLEGLQVMGVLETRSLDFDNLIFCSMNEGIYPVKSIPNSLIPYNLRRGFSLPTYELQDSVTSYHFYRSIYRAKKVYLIYDTRSEELKSGEVSRFVYQLKYHFRYPITERVLNFKIDAQKRDTIVIEKRPELVQKVNNLFVGEDAKPFSASALNTYLDCSLKFYFQSIEGLSEQAEVTESVEANTYGTLFHKVMEELYKPLHKNITTADVLKSLKRKEHISTIVDNSMKSILNIDEIIGHNLIVKKLLERCAEMMIDHDAANAPFVIVDTEKKCFKTLELSNNKIVRFYAIIDRVDKLNDVNRIIDYKTGNKDVTFDKVEKLFDREKSNKGESVAFQLYLYAFISDLNDGDIISPVFINKMFKDEIKSNKIDKVNFDEFKERLNDLMVRILDDSTPFVGTSNEEKCKYCQYNQICK